MTEGKVTACLAAQTFRWSCAPATKGHAAFAAATKDGRLTNGFAKTGQKRWIVCAFTGRGQNVGAAAMKACRGEIVQKGFAALDEILAGQATPGAYSPSPILRSFMLNFGQSG